MSFEHMLPDTSMTRTMVVWLAGTAAIGDRPADREDERRECGREQGERQVPPPARRARARGADEREAGVADARRTSPAQAPRVDADQQRDAREEQQETGPQEGHGIRPAPASEMTAPASSSPRPTAANTPVSSICSGRTTKAVSIWS